MRALSSGCSCGFQSRIFSINDRLVPATCWQHPGRCAPKAASIGGADTGLKPAQTAHSAKPAQCKINEMLQTKGKEKPQTCSIPAPGTIRTMRVWNGPAPPLRRASEPITPRLPPNVLQKQTQSAAITAFAAPIRVVDGWRSFSRSLITSPSWTIGCLGCLTRYCTVGSECEPLSR
jgi:hypothetical protein